MEVDADAFLALRGEVNGLNAAVERLARRQASDGRHITGLLMQSQVFRDALTDQNETNFAILQAMNSTANLLAALGWSPDNGSASKPPRPGRAKLRLVK
jgi:hypothetical protein